MAEERMAGLYQLGQELLLRHDPCEIADSALEIAAQTLHCQDSDFFLVDETKKKLHVISQRGKLGASEGSGYSLDSGEGIPVAAAASGQVVYVPDVSEDSRFVDTGFCARSELAIPIQI